MKKYFVITLASVAALSLTVSCSKEKDVLAPEVTPQPEKITISASFPEEGLTKVGFVEEGYNNKLNLIWQAGDKITITDEANPSNTQTFDIVSGVGTKSATFSGTAPAAAASYKITYNGNPANYAEQTQAADGDTGHLKYVATITGVTDYSSFTFPAAGSSAVLRLRTSIPDSFFGNVKAVAIKAGAASVKVNITNSADAGEANVFTVYASLPGEMAIPAGTKLYVSFQMDDTKEYLKHTAYRELAAMTLAAGKVNTINLNCLSIETSAGAADDGSSAAPYLIADQYQMDAMHNVVAAGEKKYFKMVDDVDMTGVDWAQLNNVKPYDKLVDFDGSNHTVSHLAGTVFYVFKGAARDLVLDGSSVTAGKQKGIFASYIQGSGNELTNVDICNVTDFPASGGACGGLVGRVNSGTDGEVAASFVGCNVKNVVVNGSSEGTGGLVGRAESKVTFSRCSVSGTGVTGTYYVGGLIGMASEIEISECYYKGANVVGNRFCGGLLGYKEVATTSVSIDNCYVSGNVEAAARVAGGLIGSFQEGSSCTITNSFVSGSVTITEGFTAGGLVGWVEVAGLTMTKCLAWNSSVTCTNTDGNEHYSSGAVIGYAKNVKVKLSSNYRKKNFTFSDCEGNSANVLTLNSGDQKNVVLALTSSYIRPYHGKKETGETTVSNFAKNSGINWDSSIWDTTNDMPQLCNNPED